MVAVILLLPSANFDVPDQLKAWMPGTRIQLGLDLQGGTHLLMAVKLDEAPIIAPIICGGPHDTPIPGQERDSAQAFYDYYNGGGGGMYWGPRRKTIRGGQDAAA